MLAFLLIIMLTLGCQEEFLDFQPTGVVSGDDLVNVANVEKLIVAAYAGLGNDGLLAHQFEDLWAWGTSRSDDGYKGGGGIGDLIVKLVVETPVNLSSRQKDLLKEIEESCGGEAATKHKPKSEGFFNGVKKFFDDLTS